MNDTFEVIYILNHGNNPEQHKIRVSSAITVKQFQIQLEKIHKTSVSTVGFEGCVHTLDDTLLKNCRYQQSPIMAYVTLRSKEEHTSFQTKAGKKIASEINDYSQSDHSNEILKAFAENLTEDSIAFFEKVLLAKKSVTNSNAGMFIKPGNT